MNKVEKRFISKAIIQPGGWAIYSKRDSIDFIRACKEESIRVLGIDAFYVFESGIQPSLENSIDLSTNVQNNSEKIYYLAEEFLNNKDDKFFFEIVCAD
jgi:hypothetical protein